MEITGILSALGVGIVIGLLGRLLAPTMQPIGCLLTIIIGSVGALLGTALGSYLGWGFWPTFLVQILIAVILVSIVAGLTRSRSSGQ